MLAVEDAPADVQAMIEELTYLKLVFAGIENDEQKQLSTAASILGPSDGNNSILQDLLRTCIHRASTFSATLDALDAQCKSQKTISRKWSKVKIAFGGTETFKKFFDSLSRLKVTLILAQQWSMKQTLRNIAQAEETWMETIKQLLEVQQKSLLTSERIEHLINSTVTNFIPCSAVLPAQHVDRSSHLSRTTSIPLERAGKIITDSCYSSSLAVSSTRATDISTKQSWISLSRLRFRTRADAVNSLFLGSLYYKESTTVLKEHRHGRNEGLELEEDIDEEEWPVDRRKDLRLSFQPTSWLHLLGLKYGFDLALTISQKGWQCRLRIFNCAPSAAPIFKLAAAGDLEGVQSLLLEGEASVLNIDWKGNTPLHYAAQKCHVQMCKFLLDAGADMWAENYDMFYVHNKTPIQMCAENGGSIDAKIDLMRLMCRDYDFWDQDSDGWKILTWFVFAANPAYYRFPSVGPLEWALQFFRAELRASPSRLSHLGILLDAVLTRIWPLQSCRWMTGLLKIV